VAFIERSNDKLSVRQQCELLAVNRSKLYYQPKNETEEDIWLLNLIRDIWLKHPFYGYRKITVVLRTEYQILVNRKHVLRLMRLGNIKALYPKPRLSVLNKQHRKFPYLLKEISVEYVDQVWMIDITYLKLNGRFVYLVALIDVYSRYVIGWNLSFELDTENCLEALKMALGLGIPIIINSDQGCQFTSELWVDELVKFAIKVSMDGKGRCKDNIYIERFWRSIKYEAIHLNEYKCFTELYDGVKEYIKFYNERRPHQSLHYKTPANIYVEMHKQSM
jgi:putative transposase